MLVKVVPYENADFPATEIEVEPLAPVEHLLTLLSLRRDIPTEKMIVFFKK